METAQSFLPLRDLASCPPYRVDLDWSRLSSTSDVCSAQFQANRSSMVLFNNYTRLLGATTEHVGAKGQTHRLLPVKPSFTQRMQWEKLQRLV